jgi:molybdate transport system substrate-binding protein
LSATAARAESLVVFAAASMTDAVGEAAAAFETTTGTEVVLSFAASSVLAKQIEHGAPAGVYISANPAWMDYLEERGLIVAGSRHDIARNRLAVIAPAGSGAAVDPARPASLVEALGADGRLAVGDPSHVPAGQYARQALESLGLWDMLDPRLARAANVRGAVALVERGEAPLGIVYRTDADVTDRVEIVALLPDDGHEPIRYPAARVKAGDGPAAEAFLAFLDSEEGRAILASYGFLPAP